MRLIRCMRLEGIAVYRNKHNDPRANSIVDHSPFGRKPTLWTGVAFVPELYIQGLPDGFHYTPHLHFKDCPASYVSLGLSMRGS